MTRLEALPHCSGAVVAEDAFQGGCARVSSAPPTSPALSSKNFDVMYTRRNVKTEVRRMADWRAAPRTCARRGACRIPSPTKRSSTKWRQRQMSIAGRWGIPTAHATRWKAASCRPSAARYLVDLPERPARGAGEIAPTVIPTAISNAVFSATRVRLRSVPFLPEKILAKSALFASRARRAPQPAGVVAAPFTLCLSPAEWLPREQSAAVSPVSGRDARTAVSGRAVCAWQAAR